MKGTQHPAVLGQPLSMKTSKIICAKENLTDKRQLSHHLFSMKILAGRTAVKADPVTVDPSSVPLVFRSPPRLRCLLSVSS